MTMSLVSFVIPAHNEEACLPRTLRSIHESATEAGLDYEIIVTDDGSTDRTGEIARELGATVVRSERRQIAAARNTGATASRGSILIFLDADTALRTETVRAALVAIDDGAVGGGCSVRFDGEIPFWSRVFLPVMTVTMRWARLAAGCFVYCRKDAFDAVGGFDERFYASEEIWLSNALKREGRFVILREHVITSGRKLRQYSGWQILRVCLRMCFGGLGAVQRRKGLELWYDAPRETVIPEVADDAVSPS